MELDNLNQIVLTLVLLGLITGAGILILDKFGSSDSVTVLRDVADENITWGAIGENITLDHGNLTAFTIITNDTGQTLLASNYTVNLTTGVIQVLDNKTTCKGGQPCYADYTYRDYNTASSTSLTQTRDAIGDIPETWLSLIITIVVLSIILVLIIKSFGGQR